MLRACLLALCAAFPAAADVGYQMTFHAPNFPPVVAKYRLKGDKMAIDNGQSVTIIDAAAKTITTINRAKRTYQTQSLPAPDVAAPAAGADAMADVVETGKTRDIAGFHCKQAVMTVTAAAPGGQPGMKIRMEVEMWVSNDVPGAAELQAFSARNVSDQWIALPGGAGGIGGLQQKMAQIGGVPLLQIIRNKVEGAPAITPAQTAQLDQARAKLQAMAQAGGQQGAAARDALRRMDAAKDETTGELRMELSGFSTAPIADDVFAVPAGYTKN